MSDFDRKPAAPRWGQTRARTVAAEFDQGLRRIQTCVIAMVGREHSNSGAVAFSVGGARRRETPKS
jgi:hypothetical protein